ncbi:hypothetical protein AMS62_12005 [Bacillus sp. FJAT-18019]|nr:hypothetical protein AMS62_12005 [Bacillus sp. FJAT-18019]
MGRSFANLHIKSSNLEKTVEALRALSEGFREVLGKSSKQESEDTKSIDSPNDSQENNMAMYISRSNEHWISVLHDYFVWGTVKKVGKVLSTLMEEPVMTAGFINEEIFEVTIFEGGDLLAERIFCHPLTRDEYGLQEGRLQDDYLQETLNIRNEDFEGLLRTTFAAEAVDQLSELTNLPIWSDWEWVPYEEDLRDRFSKYEF